MGTIDGVGAGTGIDSGTITGGVGVGAGVGVGSIVGMTDGAQGIAYYRILVIDLIALIVVSPSVKKCI